MKRNRYTLGLVFFTSIALVMGLQGASGCSANGDGHEFTGAGGAGGAGGDIAVSVGQGGDIFVGAGGASLESLTVTPASTSINIELGVAGATVQFEAVRSSNSDPVPDAKWSLSTLEAGTISPTGLFTANGKSGGIITVKASIPGAEGSATLTINVHALENDGVVTPDEKNTLTGVDPGQTDPGWKWVYPYDKTVFPRGILAPEIHFAPGQIGPAKYYVHITTKGYDYEGFFNDVPQLQMSQAAWDALGGTTDGSPTTVAITKIANGTKYGPVTEEWRVAKGNLHGTIYYNTYDSPLAGFNGAMMRIKGNTPTPEVFVGNCTVCHSISSDGSTAAAANHSGPGGIFDLTGGNVNPPLVWQTSELTAFGALYPKNGEVIVINGAPGGSWPPNTPGTSGTYASSLMTKDGKPIANSGIEQYTAQSPVFSHDGTMLAFTDRVASPPYNVSVLAMLHYDPVTQKFSNYEVLATPNPGRHLSWPAFTPDNKYVVFQDGIGDDLATWSANTGKLFAIELATKKLIPLTTLNGDGYMPAGARDEDLNYEPTIAPIASGGYFWIMFTSRRTYGNRLTADRNSTKRLWVSAFNVNGGDDPSHPAFYISGQELNSGNSRGFWALDPCKKDGNNCLSGDECCGGFCNPKEGEPDVYVCSPQVEGCSDEFESCTKGTDCCDPKLICVGGKCSQDSPPE